MKRLIQQKGSAHVIVVAMLVIALSAALGVIFYQNFIAKKPDPASSSQSDTTKTVTTKTAQIAFNSDIYELDHLSTWAPTTKRATGTATGDSVTTIVNSSGTVRVILTLSGTATNSSCNDDGLKISYYATRPTAVTKVTDASLYLVASMTDKAGGGYFYQIGLTPDGGATHAEVGQSHCIVTPIVGVVSSAIMSGGQIEKPTILAKIDFPKVTKADDGSVPEMQPVKDLLMSDDYKAAVAILESARKK